MDHKVSIIIPCFNQSQWLGEAIESALANKPHEVIVVIDGSEDDWEEAVFPYLDKIEIINKTNGGLSSARNAGIKISTGNWIITLDADDKLPPDYIEKCAFRDDIVGTWFETFGDYVKRFGARGQIPLEQLIGGNQTHCSALFKREIWETVGGYDEKMKHGMEDHLFWIEALCHGYSMTCTDETHLLYRKHGDSMVAHNHEHAVETKEYMTKKVLRTIKLTLKN
jgi:glycosyltransferase involved in cell wall biosynthesis